MGTSISRTQMRRASHDLKRKPLSMQLFMERGHQRLAVLWAAGRRKGTKCYIGFILTPLSSASLWRKFRRWRAKGMCRASMVGVYLSDPNMPHSTLYCKDAVLSLPSSGVLKRTGCSKKSTYPLDKLRLCMTKSKLKQRRNMVKTLQQSCAMRPHKPGLPWHSVAQ